MQRKTSKRTTTTNSSRLTNTILTDADVQRVFDNISAEGRAYERGRSAGWHQGYAAAVLDNDEANLLEAEAKVEHINRLLTDAAELIDAVAAQLREA